MPHECMGPPLQDAKSSCIWSLYRKARADSDHDHVTRWQVKISPGIMLVIYNAASSVPLKILNIEDGSVLKVNRKRLTMPRLLKPDIVWTRNLPLN